MFRTLYLLTEDIKYLEKLAAHYVYLGRIVPTATERSLYREKARNLIDGDHETPPLSMIHWLEIESLSPWSELLEPFELIHSYLIQNDPKIPESLYHRYARLAKNLLKKITQKKTFSLDDSALTVLALRYSVLYLFFSKRFRQQDIVIFPFFPLELYTSQLQSLLDQQDPEYTATIEELLLPLHSEYLDQDSTLQTLDMDESGVYTDEVTGIVTKSIEVLLLTELNELLLLVPDDFRLFLLSEFLDIFKRFPSSPNITMAIEQQIHFWKKKLEPPPVAEITYH